MTPETQIFQEWFVPFFFGRFACSWKWPKELLKLDDQVGVTQLLTDYPKLMKKKWRQLISKLKQSPSEDKNPALSFTLYCFIHDCVESIVPSLDVPYHPKRWLRGDINLAMSILARLHQPRYKIFDMLICFKVLKRWISNRRVMFPVIRMTRLVDMKPKCLLF